MRMEIFDVLHSHVKDRLKGCLIYCGLALPVVSQDSEEDLTTGANLLVDQTRTQIISSSQYQVLLL